MLGYQPQLISYDSVSGSHFLRGWLIGTRPNDRGWSVSKKTIAENVKKFLGMPFIISPKKLDPTEHFLVGKTYGEQIKDQEVVTKGHITDIYGPFKYDDKSDDVYYDAQVQIDDSIVSKALVNGKLPFATSPFIWETKDGVPIPWEESNSRPDIENWIPVHQALVGKGSAGPISVIGKQCLGAVGQCNKALAGSSEDTAEFLSSQIYYLNEKEHTMEQENTVQTPATDVKVPEVKNEINNAPIKTPEKEAPKVEVSKEDLDALRKELEAEKKTNAKLLTIHKTEQLSKIFTSFPDDETRNKVLKKWSAIEDVDVLVDFASDLGLYTKASKANPAIGSTKEEKQETAFPLTGNSNEKRHSRLNIEKSGTDLMGGIII